MGQPVILYGDGWCDPERENWWAMRDKGKILSHENLSSSISLSSFNFNNPLALSFQMSGDDKDNVIFVIKEELTGFLGWFY